MTVDTVHRAALCHTRRANSAVTLGGRGNARPAGPATKGWWLLLRSMPREHPLGRPAWPGRQPWAGPPGPPWDTLGSLGSPSTHNLGAPLLLTISARPLGSPWVALGSSCGSPLGPLGAPHNLGAPMLFSISARRFYSCLYESLGAWISCGLVCSLGRPYSRMQCPCVIGRDSWVWGKQKALYKIIPPTSWGGGPNCMEPLIVNKSGGAQVK